jgi:hypothetical protein
MAVHASSAEDGFSYFEETPSSGDDDGAYDSLIYALRRLSIEDHESFPNVGVVFYTSLDKLNTPAIRRRVSQMLPVLAGHESLILGGGLPTASAQRWDYARYAEFVRPAVEDTSPVVFALRAQETFKPTETVSKRLRLLSSRVLSGRPAHKDELQILVNILRVNVKVYDLISEQWQRPLTPQHGDADNVPTVYLGVRKGNFSQLQPSTVYAKTPTSLNDIKNCATQTRKRAYGAWKDRVQFNVMLQDIQKKILDGAFGVHVDHAFGDVTQHGDVVCWPETLTDDLLQSDLLPDKRLVEYVLWKSSSKNEEVA